MSHPMRATSHARPAMLSIALIIGLMVSAEGGAQSIVQPGPRISEARLDALRGGLDVNSVLMSIGIARAIFINGEPVVTTILNLPVLDTNFGSAIRAEAMRRAGMVGTAVPAPGTAQKPGSAPKSAAVSNPAVRPAPAPGAVASAGRNASPVVVSGSGSMRIIQNGAGNTVALQNLPSAGAIIQNTLDNQSIRSITTIDAKVFSRSIMQGLNLSASMNEAFKRPVSR